VETRVYIVGRAWLTNWSDPGSSLVIKNGAVYCGVTVKCLWLTDYSKWAKIFVGRLSGRVFDSKTFIQQFPKSVVVE